MSLNEHFIGVAGGRAQLNTPALLVDLDAFERNLAAMAQQARTARVALRPHAKAHKSIAVAKRQLEAAAVGVPDERTGEAVKLFVVKRDPDLTEDALRRHCRNNLTGYKLPKVIEFRNDLPKTNIGKILRKELR